MTDLRKAAILLSSLEGPAADSLLRQMNESQAAEVRRTLSELGTVADRERQGVIEEFLRIGPFTKDPRTADVALDESLQARLDGTTFPTPPAHAEETTVIPPVSFKSLSRMQVKPLARFLVKEHPQTIALVVSHLPADRAAKVLVSLPAELQVHVVRRLMDIDEALPEIMHDVEQEVATWISDEVDAQRRQIKGRAAMSEILDAAGKQAEHEILANLQSFDPRLHATLHRRLLAFDDLLALTDRDLDVVFAQADPQLARLALAGADESFVQRLASRRSKAEAAVLRRSLERIGPTRLSDVEAAQQEIARLAEQLEAQGRIQLPLYLQQGAVRSTQPAF